MAFYMRGIFASILCYFAIDLCLSLPLSNRGSHFQLSIIHFSDFHARFIPVSPSGGLCYDYDKQKCVGGIARVAKIVQQLKEKRKNAIFLNSGDCFQGTLYYDVYRGNITAHFMNKLPYDAMTIGNHDFDDEISGLASYVKKLNAPVVVTNIDNSAEPSLKNLYTNSTIIRRGNKDIGVIGVIFSETDKISTSTGKLKFLNEVETINLEAKKLKAKGIDIILVLSHCGINHDKIIASNCPDVDVIVGGHSHILLYNGKPPSNDIPYDKYPIVITQEQSNRKALIVHASAFTKYMGDLRVVFNENGEITHWKGNPIYLDESINQDPAILQDLEPWKEGVDKIGKVLIGQTKTFLDGTSCTSGECNLGDLVADAEVYHYVNKVSIGAICAVNLQNSIPPGPILFEDIYMTLPYNNTVDLIELQGKDLLQALEESVTFSINKAGLINPAFINWSGLKVIFNLSNKNSKVVSVQVRCHECEDKKFEDLDLNKWYGIAITNYLITDGFKTISKKHRNHIPGNITEVDNLINYVKKLKVVDIKTKSRIIFV